MEKNLDDRKAENDRLDAELGLATSYIDASAPYAVTDRLTDVPVLVVATTGIDEAAVESMVSLTRVAGGRTPGVVWLETPWDLESDDDRAALAEILDVDAGRRRPRTSGRRRGQPSSTSSPARRRTASRPSRRPRR